MFLILSLSLYWLSSHTYTMAKRVVICGGGIMGASIAYQLSLRGVAVTVVETNSVACGASGKAGGFLARYWCDGSPTEELSRLGFDMHRKFAATEGLSNCDYRVLTTLSLQLQPEQSASRYTYHIS